MVPPDPMPNSEVKRRSADGSVGSPHVRVGNCQASNKMKGSVERLGLLFLCFAARRTAIPRWRCAYRGYRPRSPEKVRSTASGESRCHSNVNERLSRKTGPFVLVFCGQARRHLPGGAALTGATDRSPACTACGKISLHHLITFIQSHIKPRRCNHFAIIHFFTAHVLTLIAKTGVTKKNVNTITYK